MLKQFGVRTEEKEKKPNRKLVPLLIGGIIFVVVALVILNKFLLTYSKDESSNLSTLLKNNDLQGVAGIEAKPKRIDIQVLKKEGFNELQAVEIKRPDISELNIGKENPFEEN